jgi:CBS domain-containing protein
MSVLVSEVMVPRVLVVMPADEVAYVREIMLGQKLHALPVFDDEERALGIVTSTDLIDAPHPKTEVADIMTRTVLSVSSDRPVSDAANLMREHQVHHLLVTDDDEVVGILSSFDLLRVIEDNGFRTRSSDN